MVGLNIGAADDACGCNGSVGVTADVDVFKSKLPSKSSKSLLCAATVGLGKAFLLVIVAAGTVTPTSVVPSKSRSALCKIAKKKRNIDDTIQYTQYCRKEKNIDNTILDTFFIF